MNTKIEFVAEKSQEVTVTRRNRIHRPALLIAIVAGGVMSQTAAAQGVSSGPCFAGAACIVNTIAARMNPVAVGTELPLTTTPAKFAFTTGTVVWVTPINGGITRGNLTSLVVLCGPATKVTLPGGNSLPGAKQTCVPGGGGSTLTIPIPAGAEGNELEQQGSVAPSGFWNLFALNPGFCTIRGCGGYDEAPLPVLIRFVPAGAGAAPVPTGPLPPPYVSSVTPACVATPPTFVTGTVEGLHFQSGARVVVSYIYFVEPNGVFRTDYNGRDSHTAAVMLQGSSSTQLEFEINLQIVHMTGGDPYGLGGNYYVQVENPDGQVSGGPIYFTAKPFQGYGHC